MKVFFFLGVFLTLLSSIHGEITVHKPTDRLRLPSLQYPQSHKSLNIRAEHDNYGTCVTKGKNYLKTLSGDDGVCQGPTTSTGINDLTNLGWDIDPMPLGGTKTDPVLRRVFGLMIPKIRRAERTRWFGREAKWVFGPGPKDYASYNNLYGPKEGVIVARNNDKRDQKDIASWSEVTWAIWVDTCARQQVQPNTLSRIIQHQIYNENTIAVIEDVYSKIFPSKTEGDQIVLTPEGNTLEGFQALLGTPNGKGIPWMLINKSDVLLAKHIHSIVVQQIEEPVGSTLKDWEMWFNLA